MMQVKLTYAIISHCMKSIFSAKNKLYIAICIAMLFVSILVMVIYCSGDDIYGDEVFSIGFANNTELLFLTPGGMERHAVNGWVSGDYIKSYYAVDEGEFFNLIGCVRQARDDVHPPLYFMLLNAVSSFAPGKATAFPGHLINISACAVMLFIIYLISYRILNDRIKAFIPVIIMLGTSALETEVTYIRMYAPLCTLLLIYIYLCMLLADEKYDRRSLYITLGLTTTIGTLTHYYYYIMCFYIALTVTIILFRQQRLKTFVKYFISQIIGAVISFACYPYVFKHMLYSERGEQAMENLGSTDKAFYLEHLKGFAKTYNTELFNGHFTVYAVIIILLSVTVLVSLIKSGKDKAEVIKKDCIRDICILIIPSFLYWGTLFKISYSTRWLYISPTFAPIILVFSLFMIWAVHTVFPKRSNIILFLAAVIVCASYLVVSIPERIKMHDTLSSRMDIIKSTSDNRDCLFIYDEWSNPHYGRDLELINYDQIMFIGMDDLYSSDLESAFENRKSKDNNLTVYIRTSIPDPESVSEYVYKAFNATSIQMIADDGFYIYNIDR